MCFGVVSVANPVRRNAARIRAINLSTLIRSENNDRRIAALPNLLLFARIFLKRIAHNPPELHKTRQIARLLKIAGGPEACGAFPVKRGVRRSNDDDRSPGAPGTLPYSRQDPASRGPGQIQIQQHQIRERNFAVGVGLFHEMKGSLTVLHNDQFAVEIVFFQSAAHQKYIPRIVLSQQYCDRCAHGHRYSPPGRVKKNVEPLPSSDSAQMRPPVRSTIF